MAKVNIPFTLIDESVLQFGFRVLLSGYQPGLFESNPVMLLMHSRAQSGPLSGPVNNDVVLPIGKWNNINASGGKLTAMPEFDDDDDFAVKVEGKVRRGYLNAASIALIPLAASDDPKLKLPGQTLATVTKWEVAECSIVDMPNCRNALAIRNAAGAAILLSSADTSQKSEVAGYLNSLANGSLPAGKANSAEVARLMQIPYDELARTNQLIKLLNLDENAYTKKYFEKGVIGLKGFPDQPNEGKETADIYAEERSKHGEEPRSQKVQELMKKSFRDLYLSGELQELKDMHPKAFYEKYKEGTGKDFPGSKSNNGEQLEREDLKPPTPRAQELMKKTYKDLYMTGELENLKDEHLSSYYKKYREGVGKNHPDDPAKYDADFSADSEEVQALMKRSWDDLWKSGDSEKLARMNVDCFYKKFKEGTGQDYPNKPAFQQALQKKKAA